MADATQPSAASATGAAPQGGVEKAPAALEETFLAVRVVCSEKHPLTGLFVIWAPILRAAAQNRAGTAPSGAQQPTPSRRTPPWSDDPWPIITPGLPG